jgi:hypothetical protein
LKGGKEMLRLQRVYDYYYGYDSDPVFYDVDTLEYYYLDPKTGALYYYAAPGIQVYVEKEWEEY